MAREEWKVGVGGGGGVGLGTVPRYTRDNLEIKKGWWWGGVGEGGWSIAGHRGGMLLC
jgi:hypothetical protein